MLEALLARRLARGGVNADVHSAGVSAVTGREPLPEIVTVMREHGIDVSGHQSRVLTDDLVRKADLVVGLSREHVREAVVLEPDAFARTFTMKELVRRGSQAGGRANGTPLTAWLASLVADREIDDLLGSADYDDVEDPVGRPVAAVRRTATELSQLASDGVALLWPEAAEP